MTVKEVLIAARKRIEKEENWAKNGAAFTKHGDRTQSDDPDATSWCALGAVWVQDGADSGLMHDAIRALDIACDGYADDFNDKRGTTHKDILDLFDKAIASCE